MRGVFSGHNARVLEPLLSAALCSPEALAGRVSAMSAWPSLVSAAEEHGVDGFLLPHLVRAGAPEEVLRAMEDRLVLERVRQERQEELLLAVIDHLTRSSIECVPLKGLVLGERILPEPEMLRPTTDVDVLVRAEEIEPALEALPFPRAKPRRVLRDTVHHDVTLDGGPFPIEVHRRLAVAFGVSIVPTFERSMPTYEFRGRRVRLLPPEQELIYLAVHAAVHRFARLGWLLDLVLFVRAHPRLDWAVVESAAVDAGLRSPVAFALEVAQQRLGLHNPLRPIGRGRARALRHLAGIDPGVPTPTSRLSSLGFSTLLVDRPAMGARSFAQKVLIAMTR